MARICSDACNGCGRCCHAMTDTIHLDPYDIQMLTQGLHKSFDALLQEGRIGIHMEEGLVLPNLRMEDTAEGKGMGKCTFLQEDGRCSIHGIRPGYCRLFPLGRDYNADTHTFRYFIVDNGCEMPDRYKVQISKWLDLPRLSRYEQYVCDWHYFIKDVQNKTERSDDAEFNRRLNLFILKVFYQTPFDPSRDFYPQFDLRLREARTVL